MVQYLHFRILKFPLNELVPDAPWCWNIYLHKNPKNGTQESKLCFPGDWVDATPWFPLQDFPIAISTDTRAIISINWHGQHILSWTVSKSANTKRNPGTSQNSATFCTRNSVKVQKQISPHAGWNWKKHHQHLYILPCKRNLEQKKQKKHMLQDSLGQPRANQNSVTTEFHIYITTNHVHPIFSRVLDPKLTIWTTAKGVHIAIICQGQSVHLSGCPWIGQTWWRDPKHHLSQVLFPLA